MNPVIFIQGITNVIIYLFISQIYPQRICLTEQIPMLLHRDSMTGFVSTGVAGHRPLHFIPNDTDNIPSFTIENCTGRLVGTINCSRQV